MLLQSMVHRRTTAGVPPSPLPWAPPDVLLLPQALKANPECAVKELKLNNNYITRFGQVALTEAVDMVYEMGGGNMLSVTF